MAKKRRNAGSRTKIARPKGRGKSKAAGKKRAKSKTGRPAGTDLYQSPLRGAVATASKVRKLEAELSKVKGQLKKEKQERLKERVKLLKEANKAKAEANALRAEAQKLRREQEVLKERIAELTKPPKRLTIEERIQKSKGEGTFNIDVFDIADDFDLDVHDVYELSSPGDEAA